MHVLIIPSEEFVPDYNKLDGIFQYHQAVILKNAGYRIGALSVRLSFSVPMILKGLLYKIAQKKAGNATDDYSALALLKLGYNKFFTPQKFVTAENNDGITIYRINGLYLRKPANNKNHVSWIKAGMVCFQEYIKTEGKPDLIHAHDSIYAGMLAEKINASFGIRYIVTEHSSTYALKTADAGILERVKKAHAKAAGLYAVSEAFARLLNTIFSFERFRYLPNVLDPYLENSTPISNQASADKAGKFIFLHIAVFKPVKDQHSLILAFKKVVQQNPATELWIGGTGELQNQLLELVGDLGLDERIKFLGLLDRDEVIRDLQQCGCFVLSSRYETFGVVTIEAMLFGKPVVVTRCGVGQDIVNAERGIVVDTENVQQLADAMLKMAATADRYDAGKIRKFAIANFGRQSFLKRIEQVYSEAV